MRRYMGKNYENSCKIYSIMIFGKSNFYFCYKTSIKTIET